MKENKSIDTAAQVFSLLAKKETRETFVSQIEVALNAEKRRSQWSKGVRAYALELCEKLKESEDVQNGGHFLNYLLSGAFNAAQGNSTFERLFNACKLYSKCGDALIYNEDICQRLFTPSEIKKVRRKDGSLRAPNKRETLIDVQARALFQAASEIERIVNKWFKTENEKKQ